MLIYSETQKILLILSLTIIQQLTTVVGSEMIACSAKPSNNITVVLVMCEISETEDLRFIRKEHDLNGITRQYNHALAAIKSLVISWKHGKYDTALSQFAKWKLCNNTDNAAVFLNIVLFTNHEPSIQQLRAEISSWDSNYTSFLNLTFREPKYSKELQWLKNMYAPCATLRILLPELMKDHDRVIYLDTDIIFLRHPQYLWDFFDSFGESTVLASRASMLRFVHQDDDETLLRRLPLPTDDTQLIVHSPILAIDLANWRKTNFMAWLVKMRKYQPRLWRFPDEILLTNYLLKHPDQANRIQLPCSWHCEVPVHGGCEPRSISILEGGRGGFMGEGNLRELYLKFERAKLNSNFSAKRFFKQMRKLFRFTKGDVNEEMHEENVAYRITRGFLKHFQL